MEFLVATAIGLLTATGLYLALRGHSFPVIVGTVFLSYAVNLFLFAMGRLAVDKAPIVAEAAPYADPPPQALVLTAIVITLAVTVLMLSYAVIGHNDDTKRHPETGENHDR